MRSRTGTRSKIIIAVLALMLAIQTGSVIAHLSGGKGGAQTDVDVRGDHHPFLEIRNSTDWTDVPGSEVRFSIPRAESRLVRASFTAESQCKADLPIVPGGIPDPSLRWCAARVLAREATTGLTLEFLPETDDYAFDSALFEFDMESHSMDRFRRLDAGDWMVWVQARNTHASLYSSWDDWMFTVERNL